MLHFPWLLTIPSEVSAAEPQLLRLRDRAGRTSVCHMFRSTWFSQSTNRCLLSYIDYLDQGSANRFCERPHSKSFRLCRPVGLCCKNSALLCQCESSCLSDTARNRCSCVLRKLYFQKYNWPDLSMSSSLQTPNLGHSLSHEYCELTLCRNVEEWRGVFLMQKHK